MMQTIFPLDYEQLPFIMRQEILQRDDYTCQTCKTKLVSDKLDIHHKIPVRKGGKNTLDNLVTLCRKCHKLIEPARSLKYAYKLNPNKSTIQIFKSTAKKLQSFGKYNESYDSIICRAIVGEFVKQKKEVAV